MRVITFLKTIDLDHYNTICYDYDKLMVSFEADLESEVFYFVHRSIAEEFLDTIYEGLENGFEEVNLRARHLYYKKVNIRGLKEYIQQLDESERL